MKIIPLTQGKLAYVDDEDYDIYSKYKWYARRNHSNKTDRWYAVRTTKDKNKKSVSLHREIMRTPNNMQVDHIDHNGLNCQKNNMRNCFNLQNGKNRTSYGKSKYLGVSVTKRFYTAHIRVNNKQEHLGSFRLETEAAIAYDIAAMKNHKEYSNPNFKYAEWFK